MVLLSIFGCEYETDDPIPGYITINNITLGHEHNAIGITDAWVYVDDNMLGVFELPANFPVIAEGSTKISIYPGIKVNGISDTRSYYPFYEPFDINVNIEAGKNETITPSSTYYDWATQLMVDDFEGQSPYFEIANASDTSIYNTGTDAIQGDKSGVVYLDTTRNYFEATTIEEFVIPDFNVYAGMYLEMNFKSDNTIKIGLFIEESGVTKTEVISLYPTDEWKKIYIDLYNPLITYREGSKIKIYIAATLDYGEENATIYLDDMKMVH